MINKANVLKGKLFGIVDLSLYICNAMKEYKTKYGTKVCEYEREDLEKLSTRELIAIIHCASNRTFINDGKYFEFEFGDYWMNVCEESVVRDILKTRPHIPNRKERKEMINKLRGKRKKNLEFRR